MPTRPLIRLLEEREPAAFLESQLPASPAPTVTLHREQLARFRNNLVLLAAFAAEVCGVEHAELCPLHLLTYLVRKGEAMEPIVPDVEELL